MPIWYLDLRPPAESGFRPSPLLDLLQEFREEDEGLAEEQITAVTTADRLGDFLVLVRSGSLQGMVLLDLTGEAPGATVPHLTQLEAELRNLEKESRLQLDPTLIQDLSGDADPRTFPAEPAAFLKWKERNALLLTMKVNNFDTPAVPRDKGPLFALLVCDPPRQLGPSFLTLPRFPRGLLIETPERINASLLVELWHRASSPEHEVVEWWKLVKQPSSQEAHLVEPKPKATPEAVRGRLLALPPGLWGRYSTQARLKRFPLSDEIPVDLYDRSLEFRSRRAVAAAAELQQRISPRTPDEQAVGLRELLSDNLVYLLRLSRRLATWTVEGDDFECTIVISSFAHPRDWQSITGNPAVANLAAHSQSSTSPNGLGSTLYASSVPLTAQVQATGETSTLDVPPLAVTTSIDLGVALYGCYSPITPIAHDPPMASAIRLTADVQAPIRECIRFDRPVNFTFTDENLRNHIELTRSENLVLFVDPFTLRVTAIGSHGYPDDIYRAMRCRRLAGSMRGIVVHIRGGKHVEVYDSSSLWLWYDGYAWHPNPFGTVESYLARFFRNPLLTGRILGTFFELLDRQASSIVAFVHDVKALEAALANGPPSQASTSQELGGLRLVRGREDSLPCLLRPMRPRILSTLVNERSIKDDLSMPALASLLQVDGAHVIDETGRLLYLAHKIEAPSRESVQWHERLAGTGREAARHLSAWLPVPGFVVKVSGSGTIFVFTEGKQATKPLKC